MVAPDDEIDAGFVVDLDGVKVIFDRAKPVWRRLFLGRFPFGF